MMKKETEFLQTPLPAGGYVAPCIRIHLTKRRTVLCGSGEIESSEEGSTGDWYD